MNNQVKEQIASLDISESSKQAIADELGKRPIGKLKIRLGYILGLLLLILSFAGSITSTHPTEKQAAAFAGLFFLGIAALYDARNCAHRLRLRTAILELIRKT